MRKKLEKKRDLKDLRKKRQIEEALEKNAAQSGAG